MGTSASAYRRDTGAIIITSHSSTTECASATFGSQKKQATPHWACAHPHEAGGDLEMITTTGARNTPSDVGPGRPHGCGHDRDGNGSSFSNTDRDVSTTFQSVDKVLPTDTFLHHGETCAARTSYVKVAGDSPEKSTKKLPPFACSCAMGSLHAGQQSYLSFGKSTQRRKKRSTSVELEIPQQENHKTREIQGGLEIRVVDKTQPENAINLNQKPD